jgi:hypothetical protein
VFLLSIVLYCLKKLTAKLGFKYQFTITKILI